MSNRVSAWDVMYGFEEQEQSRSVEYDQKTIQHQYSSPGPKGKNVSHLCTARLPYATEEEEEEVVFFKRSKPALSPGFDTTIHELAPRIELEDNPFDDPTSSTDTSSSAAGVPLHNVLGNSFDKKSESSLSEDNAAFAYDWNREDQSATTTPYRHRDFVDRSRLLFNPDEEWDDEAEAEAALLIRLDIQRVEAFILTLQGVLKLSKDRGRTDTIKLMAKELEKVVDALNRA